MSKEIYVDAKQEGPTLRFEASYVDSGGCKLVEPIMLLTILDNSGKELAIANLPQLSVIRIIYNKLGCK